MYNDCARRERRIPTDSPASVYKADDPFWRTVATVANISAHGLLLRFGCGEQIAVGAKLNIRFGSAAVAGQVKHVSAGAAGVLAGVAINNVQYL